MASHIQKVDNVPQIISLGAAWPLRDPLTCLQGHVSSFMFIQRRTALKEVHAAVSVGLIECVSSKPCVCVFSRRGALSARPRARCQIPLPLPAMSRPHRLMPGQKRNRPDCRHTCVSDTHTHTQKHRNSPGTVTNTHAHTHLLHALCNNLRHTQAFVLVWRIEPSQAVIEFVVTETNTLMLRQTFCLSVCPNTLELHH